MWNFVSADKANRALSAETKFHIQKYDGLKKYGEAKSRIGGSFKNSVSGTVVKTKIGQDLLINNVLSRNSTVGRRVLKLVPVDSTKRGTKFSMFEC